MTHILIYDSALAEDYLANIKERIEGLRCLPVGDPLPDEFGADDVLWWASGHRELGDYLPVVLTSGAVLAVLPTADNGLLCQAYGVSKNLGDSLDHLLAAEPKAVDVLTANGQPIFSHLQLGRMSHAFGTSEGDAVGGSGWRRLRRGLAMLGRLRRLRYTAVTVTTGKGQEFRTAMVGISIIENHRSPLVKHLFSDELATDDGRLSALIWAPPSIMSFLGTAISLFFPFKIHIGHLPQGMAFIQSTRLHLQPSAGKLHGEIDGTPFAADQVDLQMEAGALRIRPGQQYDADPAEINEKETLKTAHLPKADLAEILSRQHLPFFTRASEDDFHELFTQLRKQARISRPFVILMMLSTLLASVGLILNSAAVIIGAMILAPLMAPIVSFAMGIARGDTQLLSSGLRSVAWGSILAIVCAAGLAVVMPFSSMTSEIQARVNPNILDLLVAVVSGIAAAYASSRSDIAQSLAGVAIAVALVPPLAVAGIGIGFGSAPIINGSLLLFATNFFGITFAASLTFWVLGYAPLRLGQRGHWAIGLGLLLIAIPLSMAFAQMVVQHRIQLLVVEQKWTEATGAEYAVTEAKLLPTKPPTLSLTIDGPALPPPEMLDHLSDLAEQYLGEEVRLQVSPRLLR